MTIAFSTKSNRWTTRYSFKPQHYFTVDQQLVGFSPKVFLPSLSRDFPNGIAHKHDVTDEFNVFYEQLYDSKFSVVSNQNPSATKQFEALSIEDRNYGDWDISLESASKGSTRVKSLVKKHNDFYADIPRSSIINKGRLVLVGTIDKSEFTYAKINSGTLNMKTINPISSRGFLVYPRDDNGNLTVLKRDATVAVSQFKQLTGSDTTLKLISIKSVDPESKTLTISEGEYEDPAATEAVSPIVISDATVIPIFALDQNSSEAMSGDWLKLTFETTTARPKIEVYALNVDQHVVNLDHSLGQNN